MALSAVDTVLLRGNAPWTLHHRWAALAVCLRAHSIIPQCRHLLQSLKAFRPLPSLLHGSSF